MKAFDIAGLPRDEVSTFVAGVHSDPFRVLGPHGVGEDLEIRVFRPDARRVEIVLDGHAAKPVTEEQSQRAVFLGATARGAPRVSPYPLRARGGDEPRERPGDPY